MTSVLNTAFLVLVGLSLVFAVYFLVRGLQYRASVADNAYGVERQAARKDMLVAFSRTVFAVILGLIFLALFGLSFRSTPSEQAAPPTSTATALPTVTPTVTIGATNTATPMPDVVSSPAPPSPQPTETATAVASATATPEVPTAIVNSPNGLWLREAPGGTRELELIPDGTVLILLPGNVTAEELEWQQVQTPSGNEGWVAADFLLPG